MFGKRSTKTSKEAAPKSPIKGTFWLSAFKTKSSRKQTALQQQQQDSDSDELDEDSIEVSTTISTINIDEINKDEDEEDEMSSSLRKLPIPSSTPQSSKAWASPLKKLTIATPVKPSVPLPSATTLLQKRTEPDENSTEFEIHMADSSLLVHSPSSDFHRSGESVAGKSPSISSAQYDFLPKRTQIPRSPFRVKQNIDDNLKHLTEVTEFQGTAADTTAHSTTITTVVASNTSAPLDKHILPPITDTNSESPQLLLQNTNNKIPLPVQTLHSQSQTATENYASNEEHRYNDDYYNASVQDLRDEYEARMDFAKQESRSYIMNLRNQLDASESRILELERENEKLISICQDAEGREDHLNAKYNELLLEFEQLQNYCYDQDAGEKGLVEENTQLRQAAEEMANDLEMLSARLDHEKRQSLKQEADFELFSKKIKSQQLLIAELQEEKDRMQASLRKAQYDPPTEPTEVIMQKQIDKHLFDIEALKLLVQDLTMENDELKNGRSSPQRKQLDPYTKPSSPSKYSTISDSDSKWALPSESERSFFLQKMQKYEQEARVPTSVVSPVGSMRIRQYEPSASGRYRLPSRELRDLVKQGQSELQTLIPQGLPSSSEEYYQRKNLLEASLQRLVDEKKKLTFELSRIPKSGVKALTRQNELETLLDQVDREMASTRKQMKDFGLF